MSISYDPREPPAITQEMMDFARDNALTLICIMCDDLRVPPEDRSGVSFFAAVSFVPRIGEEIWLEDGKRCRVDNIVHKTTSIAPPQNKKAIAVTMLPNVHAVLIV
jgi:hypothetical protein